MKGIQYVIDDDGTKKAVLIDLNVWGEYWEDFYDILVSRFRKKEENIPWDVLKAEIQQE